MQPFELGGDDVLCNGESYSFPPGCYYAYARFVRYADDPSARLLSNYGASGV